MQFQAAELERIVASGTLEDDILPPSQSVAIMESLDEIRSQIGLTYPSEGLTGNVAYHGWVTDEQTPSRRSSRQSEGSKPRRAPREKTPKTPADAAPLVDENGNPIAPKGGILAAIRKHPTAWLFSTLAVVFVLLGTGAVFAGIAYGSTPQAGATPEPTEVAPAPAADRRSPLRASAHLLGERARTTDPRLMRPVRRGRARRHRRGALLQQRRHRRSAPAAFSRCSPPRPRSPSLGADYQIPTRIVHRQHRRHDRAGRIRRPDPERDAGGNRERLHRRAQAQLARLGDAGRLRRRSIPASRSPTWSSTRATGTRPTSGTRAGSAPSRPSATTPRSRRCRSTATAPIRPSRPPRAAPTRSVAPGSLFLDALEDADNGHKVVEQRARSASARDIGGTQLGRGQVAAAPGAHQADAPQQRQHAGRDARAHRVEGVGPGRHRRIAAAGDPERALARRPRHGRVGRHQGRVGAQRAQRRPADRDGGRSCAGSPTASTTSTSCATLCRSPASPARSPAGSRGDNAVARGHVTAKTGWIDTAYTLSGFVDAADGTRLTFAVLCGRRRASRTTPRTRIDTLVTGVYNCGDNLASF